MGIDWDSKVLGPLAAEFGVPVTYTPAKGTSFPITGVFDQAYRQIILQDDGPPITTEMPVLGVRVAEFPSGKPPRKGDTLTIPSVNTVYTVKDVHDDGHGHMKLLLNQKSAAS